MVRLIIPVKRLRKAKSRLRVPGVNTSDLVLAMIQDTLLAAMNADVGPVVLVSPDRHILDLADNMGAQTLHHDGGLNGSIAAATEDTIRCVALLADLPAVTAAQLRDVLGSHRRGFVADIHGTGTTLVVDSPLRTSFGPESAKAHRASGLPQIAVARCGLCVDVDTETDLDVARALGVGPNTGQLLKSQKADPQ